MDEVYCCICENVENSEIFDKSFIQHIRYGLCLLTYFCLLFKIRLESVTKAFISKVVLANLKVSESLYAKKIFDGILLSQCDIRATEKRNATLLL